MDLKDLSADWTEYQEELAPHAAWDVHNELYKIKGAFADVQMLPSDRRIEHVQAQTDQTHTTDLDIQTSNGIVRSTRGKGLYSGAWHILVRKVGGLSVLSLGRLCDELVFSYSWQPGENQTQTNGKSTITCSTEKFVRTTSPGETLCQIKKWRISC